MYAFFLAARPAATARLRNFVDKAAQALRRLDVPRGGVEQARQGGRPGLSQHEREVPRPPVEDELRR